MNKHLQDVLSKDRFTFTSTAFKSKLIILDDNDFNALCKHMQYSNNDYDTIIIGDLIFKRDESLIKSYDKQAVGWYMAQQGLFYGGDYNSYEDWFDEHYELWFEKVEENKFYLKDEDEFDIYNKSQVISYMASQGLVYSGLDEHQDAWFENYYRQWFQMLNNDQYILHGEG